MTIEQDREQLLLELINRARLDPAAEAARYGLDDLSAGTNTTITTDAKQVLAFNPMLYSSATLHNQYMASNDIFSHTGSGNSTLSDRIVASGYTANFTINYGSGENIAFIPFNGVLDGTSATFEAHEGLFLSAGHRRNILNSSFKELGTSVIVDIYQGSVPVVLTTNNFGFKDVDKTNPGPGIITGVHYADLDSNDFYSVGESAAGRVVKVFSGSSVVASTVTAAAGGYQILSPTKGVIEVVFSGGGLTAENGVQFSMGSSNVKLDLTDGNTIETNVSATLSRSALNLTLLSIDNVNATGNALGNKLTGNKGNNIFDGGEGRDTFVGGAGHDIVTYKSAAHSVGVDLTVASGAANSGDAVGESYSGIEEFHLTSFADSFVGSGLSDIVKGGVGADNLSGGGGSDVLIGDGAVLLTENANSIARLYAATLGRGPDDAGLAGWTAARDSGTSLNTIATGFVNSTEFQLKYGLSLSNTQFVTLLYNNVLHRTPDAAGLASWVGQLAANGSRESVVTGFSESAEFIRAADPEFHAGQIFRLYGATLDRQPDAAGFEGWVGGLDNGLGIQDVASGFIGSAEFQAQYGALNNTQFVTLLYQNVLDRAPDAGGLADWLRGLDNGSSRTSVVVGFSDSAEYIAKTATSLNIYMRSVQPDWNDTINGGAGNDYVSGGHGSDTFVFEKANSGSDQVFGFEAWDSVQLSGFGYANKAAAFAHISAVGANVVFADQGETITFHDAKIADLYAAEWLLA